MDHDISDLRGKLKLTSKEVRDEKNHHRDAVHAELIKAMRSIDIMTGITINALNHSPPRVQRIIEVGEGEVDQSSSTEEKEKSPTGVTYSSSPTQRTRSRSGIRDNIWRVSEATSAKLVARMHRPYENNNNNYNITTPKNTKKSNNEGISSPGTATTMTTGTSKRQKSPSPSMPLPPSVSGGRGVSPRNNNNNNNNIGEQQEGGTTTTITTTKAKREMDTDPQLSFEGLAICNRELHDALDVLRSSIDEDDVVEIGVKVLKKEKTAKSISRSVERQRTRSPSAASPSPSNNNNKNNENNNENANSTS